MRDSIIVKDDFCSDPVAVRQSALASGFGTWKPNRGEVGSSNYDGMCFQFRLSLMMRAISQALGGIPIFPNSAFCRVTTPETERAYIHSDREQGQWTCLCYLSEHKETYGTGFYKHRATNLTEMPSFEDMAHPFTKGEQIKKDMIEGGEAEWELLDFVSGRFNRAVIFHAPLFHARHPMHGIGGEPETARMIFGSHFDV